MFSQKQVTDVMISNAASDVVVTDGAGGTVEAGDSLLFKQLLSDGTYRNSGVIKASDILSVSKSVSVTATGTSVAFDVTAGGTGYAHSLILVIDEWGSKSLEDQEFVQGQYVEKAGDAVVDIMSGLVSNLAANLKNFNPSTGKKVTISDLGGTGVDIDVWDNPLFAFTCDGVDTITVTEKLTQRYSRGKIGYERIVFNATYKVYDSVSSDDFATVDVAKTAGVENPLDPKRVADLEWFAMANYGDQYAEAGYPHNLDREYYASPTGTYVTSFLIQKSLRGSGVEYGTNSESTLQIFCPTAATADDALAVETAIETALGITLPAGAGVVLVK